MVAVAVEVPPAAIYGGSGGGGGGATSYTGGSGNSPTPTNPAQGTNGGPGYNSNPYVGGGGGGAGEAGNTDGYAHGGDGVQVVIAGPAGYYGCWCIKSWSRRISVVCWWWRWWFISITIFSRTWRNRWRWWKVLFHQIMEFLEHLPLAEVVVEEVNQVAAGKVVMVDLVLL